MLDRVTEELGHGFVPLVRSAGDVKPGDYGAYDGLSFVRKGNVFDRKWATRQHLRTKVEADDGTETEIPLERQTLLFNLELSAKAKADVEAGADGIRGQLLLSYEYNKEKLYGIDLLETRPLVISDPDQLLEELAASEAACDKLLKNHYVVVIGFYRGPGFIASRQSSGHKGTFEMSVRVADIAVVGDTKAALSSSFSMTKSVQFVTHSTMVVPAIRVLKLKPSDQKKAQRKAAQVGSRAASASATATVKQTVVEDNVEPLAIEAIQRLLDEQSQPPTSASSSTDTGGNGSSSSTPAPIVSSSSTTAPRRGQKRSASAHRS